MNLNLKGKVAVVTGSSRGIGKGIATRFAEEGCGITICARGEAELEKTAEELEAAGASVLSIPIDLTAPESAAQVIERTVDHFGKLNILINNVGGNRRKEFAETTDQDWYDIAELNFMSHVRCSRSAIPYMRKEKGGAIVFISSIFGREAGGPGLSIYNTTKSALISVAKIMALELAGSGIRVNSVAPGSIRFEGGSWDRRIKEDPEAMQSFIETNLPIGRFGTVDEVADVVVFLASERASLVTGASLNIDGGQSHSLI